MGEGELKEQALEVHKEGGKLSVTPTVKMETAKDLSLVYTPGVAEVCKEIATDESKAYTYTIKGHTIAIVTDGSAVLGLKNIGATASLPVMEGKAALFKKMANIDAVPICIQSQQAEDIVMIAKNIAPAYGGINLEDIKAPKCFEVERQLLDLGIPVMHDDQHGTAIVILAGLINAAKVVGKELADLKVVVNGAGAAGFAVTKLLLCMGVDKNICTSVKEIIVCDSKGAIYDGRADLNKYKQELASYTNGLKKQGNLQDVITDADVFIGVSTAGALSKEMVQTMAKHPIVFAMANPTPEIMPNEVQDVCGVIGTGRSDFPNQVNNSLAFPGVFKGALDVRARKINSEMKIAAAHALANLVKTPSREEILPYTLDEGVAQVVADAVKKAAIESGVAQEEK